MRKLLAALGVAGLAAVAPTAAAMAAPTNAPGSLTFPDVTCTIGSRSLLHTVFVVNGNGQGPAFSLTGEGVFVAQTLTVTTNGQPDMSYSRGQGDGTYQCQGATTVPGPDGPLVISFVATGDFHRP
jgi:hypothetical protein